MKRIDKPWYSSKKFLAYHITLSALLVLTALRAPPEVLEHIAVACALGLPVLLGVQGWADRDATRRPPPGATP